MYEIEFLAVGEGKRSGDAILLRFTRADTGGIATVIIDAGFQSTGDKVVQHVDRYYANRQIDLAILTHPDADHIGGMGSVVRELNVSSLALHRPAAHGGSRLDAADAVDDLCQVAAANGTAVYDAFTGLNAFGGALVVAGPAPTLYEQLVQEQLQTTKAAAAHAAGGEIQEALARLGARVLAAFPVETDFDDAGGANARNNSSAIVDLLVGEDRFIFTGDAGVRAIVPALDYLDAHGRTDRLPSFIQIPHHGSRHNLDRATIERLAGPPRSDSGSAFVSISSKAAEDPRYPSPRITNAFGRRGYFVGQTAGLDIRFNSDDAPYRANYTPLEPVPAKDESIDDR
jgi:beta-lactamase superfamily II metal-dependent hydrolase